MEPSSFLAGAAKINITPTLGTLINGDFISHYARFIHDELFAKALVLTKNNQSLVLVIIDTCVLPKDFVDEVKLEIFKENNIPAENILLASTHTHAGGSLEGLLLGSVDMAYKRKVVKKVVEVVNEATLKQRPAKSAFGAAHAPEHVVCRRYLMKEGYKATNAVTGDFDTVKTNPIGDEDHIIERTSKMDEELGYLAIKGIDDQWIALLGNYSMHYVGDWPNGTISADYFGEFCKYLSAKITNPDFIPMLSNGTSGDANIWDFLQPDRYPKEDFKKSEFIGKDLAEKVIKSFEQLEWEKNPNLKVRYKEMPIKVRKPNAKELEDAKSLVIATDYETLVPNPDGLRRLFAREQVLLAEYPDQVNIPIQAISIGEGTIGGLGGEFFGETGLWLKDKIGKKYFTISLANGSFGYVPPAHQHQLGGYETWRCRTSYLEVNAEALIKNKLFDYIASLKIE